MVKYICLFIMVVSILLSCHKNKTNNDLILKKEYIGGKKYREFYVLSSNENIKNGLFVAALKTKIYLNVIKSVYHFSYGKRETDTIHTRLRHVYCM